MSLPYDNNTYKVKPLSVRDGDTFTGDVDLGFNIRIAMTFRLEGLNTPEVVGKEKAAGLVSRAFLEDKINSAKEVLVKTKKKEKYGRYLATVFCDGVNVNEQLIKEGLAVPYMI
jgi:micrococcal nuclease